MFVTSSGSERQIDADILAKCLLMARAKGRLGQEITKLTVDAPIPYLLSDLTNLIQLEMGKMDRAGDTAPYLRLKTKIDEIKADPRYGFMFSGMLVADTMADFIARDLPPAGRRQADLDHRRVGRADRNHLGRRRGAQPDGVRFRDLVAQRTAAPDPARLRGSAPLHPDERNADASSVGRILEPDRQGRPQIRRLARPDHAAPVRSRRGRAVAMRHDHLDAAQQRSRPGVRPRGDARRRARLPRFDPGAPQPRMHHLRRGRRDPDPRRVRRLEEAKRPASDDPLFSHCGARPATRTRSSRAPISAGARKGE